MHSTTKTGLIPGMRTWLFGEHDPIERQLRKLDRQGMRRVKVAHSCALAVIVLFSLASLVAFSTDALNSVYASWTQAHTVNVPAAISALVSCLIVLCMDIGMLNAAAELRVLQSRHAQGAEKRSRQLLMAAIALVETGTYTYMEWKFSHPADWIAWTLICARAVLMPVLSINLSLVRPVAYGPEDILSQSERLSGRNLMRYVITAARGATATFAQTLNIYRASAVANPQSQERLEQLIDAIQQHESVVPPPEDAWAALVSGAATATEEEEGEGDTNVMSSTSAASGPSWSVVPQSSVRRPAQLPPVDDVDDTVDDIVDDQPAPEPTVHKQSNDSRSNVRTQSFGNANARVQRLKSKRADAGRTRPEATDLRRQREAIAMEVLPNDPTIGARELARHITERTGIRCSESTAQEILQTNRAKYA